jgi:uncharacterized protein (DUF488 family)
MAATIWTIGHSNREIGAFLELLAAAGIEAVADVRRFPGSRLHPQFGSAALARELSAAGIAYQHFPALGGRRGKPAPDSPNTAWQVEAFGAYADYMAQPEFAAGLAALIELAESQRTAMMCSEAVPWRCHRRLIADALIVRGWAVLDIMGPNQIKPHPLTPFARVRGWQLTYPAETLFPDE